MFCRKTRLLKYRPPGKIRRRASSTTSNTSPDAFTSTRNVSTLPAKTTIVVVCRCSYAKTTTTTIKLDPPTARKNWYVDF